MTTSHPQEPHVDDWFNSDLNWFMGHVQSLAMSPEECCAEQGNYLVAGELFYFLLQPTSLLESSRSLLSSAQIRAIEMLRDSVRLVPAEARSGPPSAAGSLTDMQHPSWQIPRSRAAKVMEIVGPLWRERTAGNAS
ncbi:MAG: hypothetical protein Q8Q82_03350 [Hydrogenophaga sp.]|nr:hypothetical protein [Hydrogenophaga sp.]